MCGWLQRVHDSVTFGQQTVRARLVGGLMRKLRGYDERIRTAPAIGKALRTGRFRRGTAQRYASSLFGRTRSGIVPAGRDAVYVARDELCRALAARSVDLRRAVLHPDRTAGN
jgi:hypothetical protein